MTLGRETRTRDALLLGRDTDVTDDTISTSHSQTIHKNGRYCVTRVLRSPRLALRKRLQGSESSLEMGDHWPRRSQLSPLHRVEKEDGAVWLHAPG